MLHGWLSWWESKREEGRGGEVSGKRNTEDKVKPDRETLDLALPSHRQSSLEGEERNYNELPRSYKVLTGRSKRCLGTYSNASSLKGWFYTDGCMAIVTAELIPPNTHTQLMAVWVEISRSVFRYRTSGINLLSCFYSERTYSRPIICEAGVMLICSQTLGERNWQEATLLMEVIIGLLVPRKGSTHQGKQTHQGQFLTTFPIGRRGWELVIREESHAVLLLCTPVTVLSSQWDQAQP